MKNLSKILFPLLLVGLFAACKSDAPKGQKVDAAAAKGAAAATAMAKKYAVDVAKSAVIWTGTKVGGQHQGTISLSNGTLAVKGGNIEAGNFNLDMNTITVTDLEAGQGKEKLEGHLKTGDFFEIEKFSKGSFAITSVAAVSGDTNITHNITGDLTLKETTKSVTIPANIAITDNTISAVTPSFTINRTEWGINYGSGIIGTAKDKVINDNIGLVINLVANAK